MSTEILVEYSNRYGKNPLFVLAGGGNTSYKTEDTLYVKGSGTSLATITEEGFVKMDRAKLAVDRADIVLMVIDASEPLDPEDAELLRTADDRAVVCLNKSDLTAVVTQKDVAECTHAPVIELSASSGAGIVSILLAVVINMTLLRSKGSSR